MKYIIWFFIFFFLYSFFDKINLGDVFIGFIAFCFIANKITKFLSQKVFTASKEYEEEKNFQTNLRREVERKRALSKVDNENFHYQNQLRIEYIAQVAQIQLQSNQYLANMYQQAIINNSTNNELSAQSQLLALEVELKKQGLI